MTPSYAGLVRVAKTSDYSLVYLATDIYVGGSLAACGVYSPGEGELFKKVLRQGDWALDVGAQMGVLTVPMARAVGPSGRVIAFEPQDLMYRLLVTNSLINEMWWIEPVKAAVGRERGTAKVPRLDPQSRVNFGGLSCETWTRGETVAILTIDSCNLPQCRLIKIDVEGMELDVLAGATETIHKYKPYLHVEADRPHKLADLVRWLDEHGYEARWHVTPLTPEGQFKHFLSFNLFCVPKGSAFPEDLPLATDAGYEADMARGRRRDTQA